MVTSATKQMWTASQCLAHCTSLRPADLSKFYPKLPGSPLKTQSAPANATCLKAKTKTVTFWGETKKGAQAKQLPHSEINSF